jgi:tRNA1(Val) A37 N6-methylase TrmN6
LKGSGKRVSFFRGKLTFFQDKRHRISIDLVLFLTKLRGIRKSSKVIELGSGFGFLALSIARKFGCRVWAVERDPLMLELLRRNIKENGLEDLVEVVEGDIRAMRELTGEGCFDACVMNPPFFKGGGDGGIHREEDTTLEDFMRASAHAVRDGGYVNLMIPSFRLKEAILLGQSLNLPLRFIVPVFPKVHKPARLCFLTFVKNVDGPTHFEKPLIVNEGDGSYTQEVSRLLEGFLS